VLSASGLSDNFDLWLALWADLLLHPTLPAGEWTRMRQRQTAGLMQARGNPSFLATELFRRAVYGNHPAGRTAPTAASLAAITPEVIASWHRERYAPQHSILGVAGDVRPRDLQEKLERALASWKNTGSSPQPFENPPAPTATQVFLAHRPGAIQTNLTIGNLAIDRRSPDFFAMTVMNQVLGADPASRLYTNLREDKGYTYGAYSSFTPGEIVGPWYVSTDVRTGVTEAALREIFLELKRMREEKVPVKELEEKKRAIVSRLAFSVENPQELLKYALTCKSFQLTGDYWETFPQKIAAVTAEDVQLVAKKYLGVDDIQIVAIGDAAQIKGTLEKYGKVTVFSPDGPTAQ
jgi:zinc protease